MLDPEGYRHYNKYGMNWVYKKNTRRLYGALSNKVKDAIDETAKAAETQINKVLINKYSSRTVCREINS